MMRFEIFSDMFKIAIKSQHILLKQSDCLNSSLEVEQESCVKFKDNGENLRAESDKVRTRVAEEECEPFPLPKELTFLRSERLYCNVSLRMWREDPKIL